MRSVFEKLNLKDQEQILVLNAPESFEREIAELRGIRVLRSAAGLDQTGFALAFVTQQPEVDAAARTVAKKTKGDAVVWFAYPKGTSKKYKSGINRDGGWQVLGDHGFEPVRMVAIDEDWSALRFRRVEFIKTMIRSREHRLTGRSKRSRGER
ncbi:MAG TPA: hypothetical protein VJ732_12770 [Bryobacteraceae bacterium]|nr:hypothetical protein [Bryobacteraceae bacterium]